MSHSWNRRAQFDAKLSRRRLDFSRNSQQSDGRLAGQEAPLPSFIRGGDGGDLQALQRAFVGGVNTSGSEKTGSISCAAGPTDAPALSQEAEQ